MNVIVNGLLLNGLFSGVQHSIEHTLLAMSTAASFTVEALLPRSYTGILQQQSALKVTRPAIDCSNRMQRILWEQVVLPFYLKKKQNAIYHSPGYILPYWSSVPMISTIHDLIALQFPHLSQRESAAYFKATLPRSIRQADRIIAVSETVKQDILEKFPIAPDRIQVIYHGVRSRFKPVKDVQLLRDTAARYQLPEQYLLFVGNLEPRKNIERLLQAFALLKQQTASPVRLVLAGREGWKYGSIYRTVKELRLTEEVLFLGYVPDKDLPALYTLAALFVFPSLYEGFGLPVLEAMACGTPVVTSTAGALPEICGPASAVLVNPYAVAELAAALYQLLSDSVMREEYSRRGLDHVKKFSWEQAARSLFALYETI